MNYFDVWSLKVYPQNVFKYNFEIFGDTNCSFDGIFTHGANVNDCAHWVFRSCLLWIIFNGIFILELI